MNPNIGSTDGLVPLHLAAEYGHLNIVQYFIEECHIDVNTKRNSGWTALHFASLQGHMDIVQYLVHDCQADVNVQRNTDQVTPLFTAIAAGHLDIVQYYIEDCHVDLDIRVKNGITALYFASCRGQLEIVKYLIQHGCLVDDTKNKADDGSNALHAASTKGYLDIVQYFVQDCHIDPNQTNNHGATGLYLACHERHWNIVHYFAETVMWTSIRKIETESPHSMVHACMDIWIL
jgi:ankyrin repeat protein